MKKILFLFAFIGILSACSSDDNSTAKVTKATLALKDASGQSVSGITVYAYDQDTWEVIGDNPLFAEGQAASDANGNAIFNNIEYANSFNDINNNQNTFRFSAHYTLGGTAKTKVTAITFTKGEQKTESVTLN